MWYVNKYTRANTSNKTYSFILTMWYVNIFVSRISAKPAMSFILTMWYVNLSGSCTADQDVAVLY